ncbi:IS481 family transposase domain protein [Rickettsiales endosymbiont of Paramecium tredecaurelia]|uniref:IS481 family transposase n=1 Tax=Candidatus Sarmatiella mevalonica TaxID=2770581 RepID=UPI0019211A4E|nr:IS481 family transposase [Candidatus Sarmatiella mevalonica]MBL3284883.1 IS481 family transposase domain protein [Candidatus Sarmatiella mevalonica]
MGQILHANARTTEAIRREIRDSKESIEKAAKRFNVNPKTIIKWRKREDTKDLPMGPKKIKSTVLSEAEEESIVAFRKMTELPLDDVLYSLQETIPYLSRSSLHRCLKRHGCSVLPKKQISTSADKKKFKQYPIGYFHIDIAEVRTAEGKLYLYVVIDRTSKFAYAELHKSQTKMIAAEFLRNLIKAVPYKIHKVLTDNGIQFTNHDHHKNAFTHIFECVCNEHQIEHRKTKIKHPWTNGQVERMNRTLKEATVNSFHYASHDELKQHLHAYLMAYNFAKRLKAIKGKTPWQFILNQWTTHPEYFILNPNHFLLGLNTKNEG